MGNCADERACSPHDFAWIEVRHSRKPKLGNSEWTHVTQHLDRISSLKSKDSQSFAVKGTTIAQHSPLEEVFTPGGVVVGYGGDVQIREFRNQECVKTTSNLEPSRPSRATSVTKRNAGTCVTDQRDGRFFALAGKRLGQTLKLLEPTRAQHGYQQF